MKLFLTLIIFFVALQTVKVQGTDVLRVLLNKGNSTISCNDQYGDCCNAVEWDYISGAFYNMTSKKRRGLRGDETAVDLSQSDERELTIYPLKCANLCAGFIKGRCLASQCKGYRRSLVDRNLYYGSSCSNQRTEVRNLLTNIGNMGVVGASCQALLKAPILTQCIYNYTASCN